MNDKENANNRTENDLQKPCFTEETKQLTMALHQHASSRFSLQRHSAK